MTGIPDTPADAGAAAVSPQPAPTVNPPIVPEPRDGFVVTNGLRLHYLEWGRAGSPPVLLLHGGTAHAHWWTFFVQALGPGHHVFALDLRGHGDSDWATPAAYRLTDHAADVGGVCAALNLSSVTLIGHSFGGMVAIEHAAAAPQRLAQLIIVDTRTSLTPRAVRFMKALQLVPHRRHASHADAAHSFRLLPDADDAPDERLAHVAAHAFRRDADGLWILKFDPRALGRPQVRDFAIPLATVSRPTLFVRGEHSDVISRAEVDAITAAVPRLCVAEIAGAHHHVMLDQPEALAAAVHTFIGPNRG